MFCSPEAYKLCVTRHNLNAVSYLVIQFCGLRVLFSVVLKAA